MCMCMNVFYDVFVCLLMLNYIMCVYLYEFVRVFL
jgi:hypothetical protein